MKSEKEMEEMEEKAHKRFDYVLWLLTDITATIKGIKREVISCEYTTEEFKKAYIKGLEKAENLVEEEIEKARKDVYDTMYMNYRNEYRKLTKEDQPEEDYDDYDEEDY